MQWQWQHKGQWQQAQRRVTISEADDNQGRRRGDEGGQVMGDVAGLRGEVVVDEAGSVVEVAFMPGGARQAASAMCILEEGCALPHYPIAGCPTCCM